MADVDYNEWGMDLEEWERMEMGPPPPHLYADNYEEQEHDHESDEEVIMITVTNVTHELCGSKEPKNQFPGLFDERFNEGADNSLMKSPKAYNYKIMHHGHDIMMFSIEALAMAGVDYSGLGMDFEEWERMEMGPPPPHLYADEQEQEQEHEYEREYELEEEVNMMTITNVTDGSCGSIKSKKQETDVVFDERKKEGGDDFTTKSRKIYNYKIMYHTNGIKRLKMIVDVMMVIGFLRRQIL
ncbi:hypothetical protein R6Q57_026178 [Mikania cordata]